MTQTTLSIDETISEVSAQIFNLIVPLQTPEKADHAPDDLRAQVESAFVLLERRCFELQVTPDVIRNIKFAMTAFSDEVVLNSRWPKKYDWMAKPLAIEYFGDASIGQSFFTRLDELRSDSSTDMAVLNLYFTILLLGFQGKYRLAGYEQLQAYLSTFRAEIEQKQGRVNRILSENAAPEHQMKSRIAGQQSYWVMSVLFVAAIVVMTVVYSTQTQDAIQVSAQSIEKMTETTSMVDQEEGQ
ncbi:DotU family type IV/VI secretion system protein [Reinekea blandensis]|uniref:Type IV / VI secretion system DotU domain-containing protein n=1 Tax=Reinekea blandensis MED297 TaxID=314283 RepID=A4BEW2_9GAMM|nr:DotU family type IV/VI secretion system protein [Reinekea blandensis]EAR09297.1 hypothetical protein MED297_18453 [Reinekea sp. MED297] [Reinekea blandensis MED297]